MDPLREISFQRESLSGIKFNRYGISARYGGYQALVHKNLTRLAATWFPDLVDSEHIGKLFPDELSAAIRELDFELFRKTRRATIASMVSDHYQQKVADYYDHEACNYEERYWENP